MNSMKKTTTILAIVLCAIALFSAFYLVTALVEKIGLQETLDKRQLQVSTLRTERTHLMNALDTAIQKNDEVSRKNALLKEYLRAGNDKVRKLDSQFKEATLRADQLNSQVALLKTENVALRNDNEELKVKAVTLTQENDQLKVRLSSMEELKMAIRELKIKARRAAVVIKEKVESARVAIGNRGYLVKDRRSTYPAKVKIEVNPAPAN